MDILGIGPAELVMIVILLLLVLGPTDVVELFRKIGRGLRKLRESPTWTMINSTARSLRNLPNTLAEETGVEDLRKDLLRGAEASRSIGKMKPLPSPDPDSSTESESDYSAWTTAPVSDSVTPPPTNYRTRPVEAEKTGEQTPGPGNADLEEPSGGDEPVGPEEPLNNPSIPDDPEAP